MGDTNTDIMFDMDTDIVSCKWLSDDTYCFRLLYFGSLAIFNTDVKVNKVFDPV